MKIAVFSSKSYDKEFFNAENSRLTTPNALTFYSDKLSPSTVSLAAGYDAVCIFVNDQVTSQAISTLSSLSSTNPVRLILLRCAGFNNVDLLAAKSAGIKVMRVPVYSPYAVAEHAVGLILALNRKIHKSYNRVREHNFDLEGLLGFDLRGKTVGVLGTGKIGAVFAEIMKGFGVNLIAYDVFKNEDLIKNFGVKYVELDQLYAESDIISMHIPLFPTTFHMINADSIEKMKKGVMLINTSRGGLVDTKAVIQALKTGKIGSLGVDVYEEEADLFFENLSGKILQDDVFARLLTFPNVVITGHQAFFTKEAQEAIAKTTMKNVEEFLAGKDGEKENTTELTKTVSQVELEEYNKRKVVTVNKEALNVLRISSGGSNSGALEKGKM